jgi:hypothetical protein
MREFMENAREGRKKTDVDLLEMVSRAHPLFNRNKGYGTGI